MTFDAVATPAALIDMTRMRRNIITMQQRMNSLGVKLRPHVKTNKCVAEVLQQSAAGAGGITVSTLKEAAQFSLLASPIFFMLESWCRASSRRRNRCATTVVI